MPNIEDTKSDLRNAKPEYAGPQFHLWSGREGFSLSKQSFAHFRASRLKTLLDLSGVRIKSQRL